MFLETLAVTNYRSFDQAEIELCEDLTILVGENNAGKSNAIDGIRLLTHPLGSRRELYCETTDIRFGSASKAFELSGRFSKLSAAQKGRFVTAATDPAIESCIFGLRYDESTGQFPARPVIWAGKHQGNPEPGCHEMIRHVYLPPLRDAKRALASGNSTRIYALLKHFLNGGDPEKVAADLRRKDDVDLLRTVSAAVEVGLKDLTSGVRQQTASLGFAQDEQLIDIARDLRFKLADHGLDPEDLRYSGHGYANLLYMATIAVELEKVNSADLTLFLVEEPEAHLHPQLQAAVLSFLEERATKSRQTPPGHLGPAGELQIIVATHSPNLSAWVESKKLVFFRSTLPPATVTAQDNEEGEPSFVKSASTATAKKAAPRRATRCLPLRRLALKDEERRKIDRYLDVTKSAMLFGGRVFLAEGIAEVLLLPVIARKIVLKNDAEKLRRFRSAVFVPIDGVDFQPYAKLLLSEHKGVRISDRLVVLTDGDSTTCKVGEKAPGALRKEDLEALAKGLVATDLLQVVINEFTLEPELLRAGNGALMKTAYLTLHRRSEEQWDDAVKNTDAREQAFAVQKLFERTRKGDFAQLLADAINEGQAFTVPQYIHDAILALVK